MAVNLIKFLKGTQQQYNDITTKDENTLYFCTDTQRFFIGAKEITRPLTVGNGAPSDTNLSSNYPPYSLYFNNATLNGGILYYNDGSHWYQIYNLTEIAEQFNRRKEIFTGICNSSGSATVKIVECEEFLSTDLTKSTLMAITFNNTNTAAVADLKIKITNDASADPVVTISNNSNGDPIKKHYGTSVADLTAKGELRANETYLFAFDGTNWVCLTLNYNSSNTDTKVTQSIATANTDRPLLLSYYDINSTTTTAQTAYRNPGIYANPSTGALTATSFNGALNGTLGHSLTFGNGTYVFDGSADVTVPLYDGSYT